MTDIVWQDPPSRSSGARQYDGIIETLKKNPDRWALVVQDWKTSVAPTAFRQNKCEVTTRRNKDSKTWNVYARFPATKAQPAAQTATQEEQAKVRAAVQTGTALTPPRPAPKQNPAPQPAPAVKPANDFGMDAFRKAREARGVPPEGKR